MIKGKTKQRVEVRKYEIDNTAFAREVEGGVLLTSISIKFGGH